MTDQRQRTQWALDRFRSFVEKWTPPGAWSPSSGDRALIENAITAIAPRPDDTPIGYGVFRREIDADWDIRQRPSGFVHTLVSAVFDKPAQAENAHQGTCKRHPDQHFIICEIREIP
jgi:hypothetical protein